MKKIKYFANENEYHSYCKLLQVGDDDFFDYKIDISEKIKNEIHVIEKNLFTDDEESILRMISSDYDIRENYHIIEIVCSKFEKRIILTSTKDIETIIELLNK